MELLSFAGESINGSTGIIVQFGYGQWQPNAAATNVRQRIDMPAVIDTVSYPTKQQPFVAFRGVDYVGSTDDFLRDVNRIFSVRKAAKPLIADRVSGDSSTEVQVSARVIKFGRAHDNLWSGIFEIADPVWQSTATLTDSTSPTTNAGDFEAIPSIAITGGDATVRNRCTITDRTGHGIGAYPVQIAYGTGHDSSSILVFAAGRSVPFLYDPTGGRLWVRIDCNPLASTSVDIYRSDGITNDVTADMLDLGGVAIDSADNDTPTFDDYSVEQHPGAASISWHPINMPNIVVSSSNSDFPWTYQLYDESADSVTFEISAAAQQNINDTNGVSIVLPAQAASGATLTASLTLDTIIDFEEIYRNIVPTIYVRKRDEITWRSVATYSIASGLSLPFSFSFSGDVSGAVEIAVVFGAQYAIMGSNQTRALFEITDLNLEPGLDSTQTPSVSLSADIDARHISGALINTTTAEQVTFTDLLFDDVTFTLDPLAGSIVPDSGPWYAADIAMTNASQWFTLDVGDNDWTAPGSASVEFSWHERSEF